MATESGPDKPGYDGGWRGAPWPRPSRVMYHRGNKKRKRLARELKKERRREHRRSNREAFNDQEDGTG